MESDCRGARGAGGPRHEEMGGTRRGVKTRFVKARGTLLTPVSGGLDEASQTTGGEDLGPVRGLASATGPRPPGDGAVRGLPWHPDPKAHRRQGDAHLPPPAHADSADQEAPAFIAFQTLLLSALKISPADVLRIAKFIELDGSQNGLGK